MEMRGTHKHLLWDQKKYIQGVLKTEDEIGETGKD